MLLVWALALYVATRGRGPLSELSATPMGTFAVYLPGLWAGALAFPDQPNGWALNMRSDISAPAATG
jgi:hypothetical protein